MTDIKHRNLWPQTVIALTLSGIDPTPVLVLGLSTKGYRTFVKAGEPETEFHDWPSTEVADRVWSAYVTDAIKNRAQWEESLRGE